MSLGNVRSETLRGFSVDEAKRMIGNTPLGTAERLPGQARPRVLRRRGLFLRSTCQGPTGRRPVASYSCSRQSTAKEDLEDFT